MGIQMKFILLYICLMYQGITMVNANDAPNTFNVLNYGAKADGVTDNSKAFQDAWRVACNTSGGATILVPSGTYFLNPVQFNGPCQNVYYLTFKIEGTLKASTDLNIYGDRPWVQFGWLNNFFLTGGGTFDGQGEVSWPFNKCPKQKSCKLLPTSIFFINCNNTIVKNITSLNSKLFHMGVVHSNSIKISNMTITAPEDSPNTDGIHLQTCTDVTIQFTKIATGDDCISIGPGNFGVSITGVSCGPGHGISIGSLGKYPNEQDVNNITVQNCYFTGTSNGVRIKTWANSKSALIASNMTFQNLLMNKVGFPIIIDQEYCPYINCDNSVPSRVQISDIRFHNIRGTAAYREAVTIKCSKGVPCSKIALHDIDLKSHDGILNVTSLCASADIKFTGNINPPPCQ